MEFLLHKKKLFYNQYSSIILCVFLVLCTCSDALLPLPNNVTIPAIFAFGDSIVDQGTNNDMMTFIRSNFPPYGQDFPGGVATGRFSNGKTPPDLLAEALGIADLIPAYRDPNLKDEDLPKGVSFASGGCGYDPLTSELVAVMSLSNQLDDFKEYMLRLQAQVGLNQTNFILSNALYMVVAGSDDLANTYFTAHVAQLEYDIPSYTDLVVKSASNFVQELYNLGARRMAVFGIPPIGCLPFQRTVEGGDDRACVDLHNQAAQLLNGKLSIELSSLGQSLNQSKLVYIDIYNPLLDIIQNSQNYGFEVSDKGCCGSGTVEVSLLCSFTGACDNATNYIFWDSFHPTQRAYEVLIGQTIAKYFSNFTS